MDRDLPDRTRLRLPADRLWTAELTKEVHDAFVGHPGSGTDDFMTKLRGQLKHASPDGRKLMAKMFDDCFPYRIASADGEFAKLLGPSPTVLSELARSS